MITDNKNLRTLLAALAIGAVPLAASAHGERAHDAKDAPLIKEQTAWGIAAEADKAERTLEVVMSDDMRFTPDRVTFTEGETVRLVVKNAGKIMHELVIGDQASLAEHAEMMVRFPNMEHDEPYMAHVPPGETREIVWTFNRDGEFEFACLIPGHYQAGMLAKVEVVDREKHAASGHGH